MCGSWCDLLNLCFLVWSSERQPLIYNEDSADTPCQVMERQFEDRCLIITWGTQQRTTYKTFSIIWLFRSSGSLTSEYLQGILLKSVNLPDLQGDRRLLPAVDWGGLRWTRSLQGRCMLLPLEIGTRIQLQAYDWLSTRRWTQFKGAGSFASLPVGYYCFGGLAFGKEAGEGWWMMEPTFLRKNRTASTCSAFPEHSVWSTGSPPISVILSRAPKSHDKEDESPGSRCEVNTSTPYPPFLTSQSISYLLSHRTLDSLRVFFFLPFQGQVWDELVYHLILSWAPWISYPWKTSY